MKLITVEVQKELICHECEEPALAVAQVGEEPYYESATARLCLGCLKKAVLLIEERLNLKEITHG